VDWLGFLSMPNNRSLLASRSRPEDLKDSRYV
jgi:hypothetical protein